jgi:hypothetical protein
MSQSDYVIDDAQGLEFLADLNAMMQAIVTLNSGASEPGTTYPYQFWADTTNGLLKQRNAANNAWVTVCTLANWAIASVQLQASVAFTTTGTAPAFAVTTGPVLTLAANQRLRLKFNQDNGGAPSTLAKDGGATKAIKVYSAAGVKEDPIIYANVPYDVEYDGTDWVILNRTPITAAGFANIRVYQRWNGTASISGTTMTVSAHGSGSLSIGSVVTGTGVSANTIVQSFGTYTPGGTGTVTVNNSQTVGSVAMSSVTASFTVPSAKVKVTVVGAGGGGGSNNNGNGSTGGTSSFGSHCSATGGGGGIRGNDSALGGANDGMGGAPGMGSGGDLNVPGSPGSNAKTSGAFSAGAGGSSMLSGGGRATQTGADSSISGTTPSGYGGGGSGGYAGGGLGGGGGGGGGASVKVISGLTVGATETVTPGAGGGGGGIGTSGGNGAPGVVIVEW